VALANGLYVENTPPWRLILLGERTVAHYPVDDSVQERLALVHLVAQGWMPATAWAEAFGLHRNSLGNWTWRYRYFGLEGLRDDVLPGRQHLRPVLAAAQELVQGGRRVTVPLLREELKRRGLAELSPEALRWLLLSVNAEACGRAGRPQVPSVNLDEPGDSGDPAPSETIPGAADGGRIEPLPDRAAEPAWDGGEARASAEPASSGDAAPVDPDAAWLAAESSSPSPSAEPADAPPAAAVEDPAPADPGTPAESAAPSPGKAGEALDGGEDAPPAVDGEDPAPTDPGTPAESAAPSPGKAGEALAGGGDAPPAQPDPGEDRTVPGEPPAPYAP